MKKIINFSGFTSQSLLMKDLGMVIPSPICNFHEELLNVENTTGKFLMETQLRKMLVSHRNGYEVPVSLGIRVNSNIYNRVEYVGALNFDINGIDSCVLLVSKHGRIMSLTKSAKDYFKLGHNLSSYNPDFTKIFKVFFLLILKNISIFFLNY